MAEINWGLLDVPDIGGNALAAFHQGRQIREQKDTKAAWSAYAANPDDPNALNALAQYDPKSAIALRQDSEKRRREMQAQDLQRKAVAGDPAALAQLSGIDLDAWSKVDSRQKAQIKEQASYIGNAALAISRLPPQQQAQAWDQAAQQGAQLYPELAQQIGKFSPQGLQAALANANMISKFIDVTEPKYQVIPEGGSMVNTNDPAAIKQFQQSQSAGPQPGMVKSGYRFKGGNPNDRASWEPVGGTGGNASGGFQPVGLNGERVTSTTRSPARNKAVGGVGNSFHLSGKARDSVPPPGMSMQDYYLQLKRLNPGLDVINEGDHIHMEPR